MKYVKRFNEKGDEIPTFKQLGITPEIESKEMSKGNEHFNEWYDDKVKKWQALRRIRNTQIQMRKAEKAKLYTANHWYNNLQPQTKKELVLRVAKSKDEIIVEFLLGFNIRSPLFKYYQELGQRIDEQNYQPQEISISKLSRLPDYIQSENKLSGTNVNFINLFIACFPPLKKKKKVRVF